MKIGIAIPQAGEFSVASLRAFVRTVELVGLDSLWVGDHLVFPPEVPRDSYPFIEGMHDRAHLFSGARWSESVVTLSAGTALTDSLELGFAVLLPALRNPLVLAKQLASIDALSGGRLIVGVGVGWLREEFRALGVPFEERIDRLVEFLEVARLVWGGGPVSHRGQFWSFDQVIARPAPTQGSGLRVWYGGNDVRLLRRLGPIVEGWLPYEPTVEDIEQGREVFAESRAEAGVNEIFSLGAVTRLPLGDSSRANDARRCLETYRATGVDHLVVLSSMGRDVVQNRQRVERLGAVAL